MSFTFSNSFLTTALRGQPCYSPSSVDGRETEQIAQGPIASKQQVWDLNLGTQVLKPVLLMEPCIASALGSGP